jgi:hypothetical protein
MAIQRLDADTLQSQGIYALIFIFFIWLYICFKGFGLPSFLYFFMVGMFRLLIVGLFCYICVFYYLYVDFLTYAFGWSAFLCRIRFCDTLIVIFFK